MSPSGRFFVHLLDIFNCIDVILISLKLSSDSVHCSDVSLATSIILCTFVFVRLVLLDSPG